MVFGLACLMFTEIPVLFNFDLDQNTQLNA